VGQEHITTALANALKSGAISHAYLFTGPRGVGKTSIARILAHEVNGLAYDENATHLDIIEIDAASNRRIDEIRSLREKVHNAPTSAKYKVYIIDEVHMLTKEAFNALLKTLEEPPAHAIFILATTEAHKLPETIVSRTQRYTFKPVELPKAVTHLQHIAKEEGIDISEDALELLARHGGGSFRDSISLLDQVSNVGGRIELSDVQRMLGIAPEEAIRTIIQTLQSGTPAELIDTLRELHEQGFQAPQLAKQLTQALRVGLLSQTLTLEHSVTSTLMQRLLAVPASHDPAALLEILLLEQVLARAEPTAPAPQPPKPAAPAKKSEKKEDPPAETPVPKPEVPAPPDPPEPQVPVKPDATNAMLDENTWQQTLQAIKQKHNTLYGIARMAAPIFNDGELTLSFSFPFHQKRLNDSKNKKILSDTIAELTGISVVINCIVDKANRQTTPAPAASEPEPPKAEVPASPAPLEAISNIFGSAEVLE